MLSLEEEWEVIRGIWEDFVGRVNSYSGENVGLEVKINVILVLG